MKKIAYAWIITIAVDSFIFKIMFIIFPGFGTTSKYFNLNYPLKESKDPMLDAKNNSNFIPELKKIGK